MKNCIHLALIVFFTQVMSSGVAQSKVLLLKQWHLLAKKKTLNIEESSSLPQAQNQLDLYRKLKQFVKNNKNPLLLFEGCEGTIDEGFTQEFQGWNYQNLQEKLSNPKKYQKILTHVGLKLEVELKEKADNRCGDNLKLVESHQLAFSDFKAYLGYSQRLEQHQDDPDKLALYADSMTGGNLLVVDPFLYALESAKNSFLRVKLYLRKRNESFIQKILKNSKREIAVVIGGLHVEDFVEQLKGKKIAYEVYTPKGYPEKDGELLKEFEKILFKK